MRWPARRRRPRARRRAGASPHGCLLDTVVPGDLALPPVDVDDGFGRRARRRRGALRALPPRRLGRARRSSLLVTLARVRPLRRPLRTRVGGGADRHRDAPRHARARDRLARRSCPSRSPPSGGSAATTSPRSGYLEAVVGGLARARRDVRRDLHRAPRRDGARAVARQLVVDPGRSRVHRDRVGARARRARTSSPASRSRTTPSSSRDVRALRALAGRRATSRSGSRR